MGRRLRPAILPKSEATAVVVFSGRDVRARAFPDELAGHVSCLSTRMPLEKRFVYILRNRSTPTRYYTGLTSNVAARQASHNAGHCTHTAAGRPWAIDAVIEFNDEKRAVAFEQYLKSGSGVAFATRHLR